MSQDSIARLNEFSADPEYCAGKFPVASDATGSISKSFNLKVFETGGKMKDTKGRDIENAAATERTTYVIMPDRKIIATLSSAEDVSPTDHVDKSLAVVTALKK